MNRIVKKVLCVCCVAFLLCSCTPKPPASLDLWENEEPTEEVKPQEEEPAPTPDPTKDEEKAILSDSFNLKLKEKEISITDLWDDASMEQLACEWAETTYAHYQPQSSSAKYINGMMNDTLSVHQIGAMIVSVQLSTLDKIPGMEPMNDVYTMDVLLVLIEPDEETRRAVLCDVLGPDAFEANNVYPTLYKSLESDSRFASTLKPYPQTVIPKEVEMVELATILEGQPRVFGAENIVIMEDGTVAVLVAEKTPDKGEGYYHLGVRFYKDGRSEYVDAKEEVFFEETIVNNQFYLRSTTHRLMLWENQATIVVENQQGEEAPTFVQMITVERNGKISEQQVENKLLMGLLSPDKTKLAYTKDYDTLCIEDLKTNKIIAEIKGSREFDPNDVVSSQSSRPSFWMDNNRLVYTIYGYEWIVGTHVYDIAAQQDITLTEDGNSGYVVGVSKDSVYFSSGLTMTAENGQYVESTMQGTQTGTGEYLPIAFSPDGSKMASLYSNRHGAAMVAGGTEDSFVLEVKDSATGKVLKSYALEIPFSDLQSVSFYNKNQICGIAYGYAMAPDRIYFF